MDVRVIAATNRDPYEAIREGSFREDLLYRLAVVPLHVPPLRQRAEDVIFLAQYFLDQLNGREKLSKTFSEQAILTLQGHDWPGNVRELKNTVHRAFILADEVIEIPERVSRKKPIQPDAQSTDADHDGESLAMSVGTKLADAQRNLIMATLAHHDGDKRRAAETLGISLKTLYNRLDQYQNA